MGHRRLQVPLTSMASVAFLDQRGAPVSFDVAALTLDLKRLRPARVVFLNMVRIPPLIYEPFVPSKVRVFTTLAGLPATMVLGSTSWTTTDPAATIALSPMVTPCNTIELKLIHTR